MSYRVGNGRPSSAASRSSSGHERRGSFGDREHFLVECRAAYLAIFDSLSTHITSRHDLYKVLQQSGRNPVSRTLNKYWTDRTDQLTFEDFCDICRKEAATSEDELFQAFRKIDVNGDGFITNTELRKILTTRGEKMTKEEVQDLIDEVDENRDGKLNYKEFIRMIMKTQEECKRLAVKNLERKQNKVAKAQGGSVPRSSKAKPDYDDDDDDDDDDEIVIGVSKSSLSSKPFGSKLSPPTPTPRSIRSIKDQAADESGSSSSRSRDRHEWSKPGLTSKQLTLQKPRNLKDWRVAKSKGCFFFDEHSNIVGHQFNLKVAQDTKAWITIEPISMKSGDLNGSCEKSGAPMDVMLFMLDSESRLVACTDQRDQKGKSAMICDVEKGTYRLIAFTTGCRFKKRPPLSSRHSKDVELIRKKDGKVSFTRDYKNVLTDVFDMFDLNGDELLSRDEFSLYNLRTSGQEVADPEWEAVEANIDLKDGQITRDGFLHLNQMEAEENQDNIEELWMALDALGFSRALVLDEASPFSVEVHIEKGNLSLKVAKLDAANKNFTNVVAQKSVEEGESFKVKGVRDIFLCAQITDGRVCLVVENKSLMKTSVMVDCKQSVNIASHQKSLSCIVDVPPRAAVVAHHLLPVKDSHAWTVVCQESLK